MRRPHERLSQGYFTLVNQSKHMVMWHSHVFLSCCPTIITHHSNQLLYILRPETLKYDISVDDTKEQHPETHQDDQRHFSHSSRRPQSNLENGSLEIVQGPSSSQIYPHNKSGTSSGCVENRNFNSISSLAGSYSPPKYNTPDRPSCTPSKSHTIPETDESVKRVLESSSSLPLSPQVIQVGLPLSFSYS